MRIKNIAITPIAKSDANSQSKPQVPKSQTQKGKGNLASGLSLLKSKSGSGPVDNPMSDLVHNRTHGLFPVDFEISH